uniref:Splicing factor 3B subunit 4 n=1 Tax=Malurus cyaneus samueli TaxID=2593467 RepID=A0A8C5TE19_9PASS
KARNPSKGQSWGQDRGMEEGDHLFYLESCQGPRDADYAIKIMNMIKLYGKPIRVNKASAHNKNLDVGANIFIGNLDPEIDEKLLYDTFSAFGVILQTPKIMRDPDTGNSKGYAFINFASFDASDAAIEAMNGQYLCNRPITVSYAFKKDSKGERHGSAAERLLAAQNPLSQADRPHQLFADAPPPPSVPTPVVTADAALHQPAHRLPARPGAMGAPGTLGIPAAEPATGDPCPGATPSHRTPNPSQSHLEPIPNPPRSHPKSHPTTPIPSRSHLIKPRSHPTAPRTHPNPIPPNPDPIPIPSHQTPIPSHPHNKNLDVGANIFIGNLDPEIDEKLLYDTFSAFGVILQTPKIMRDPDTGNSKGYAFINFASFDASDAAIEAMNGQYLCNRPITVSYAFKKDSKGERHGSAAERLLAAQNPLSQADRPHQLFADAPPPPSVPTPVVTALGPGVTPPG